MECDAGLFGHARRDFFLAHAEPPLLFVERTMK
jgi:hypothetical protein